VRPARFADTGGSGMEKSRAAKAQRIARRKFLRSRSKDLPDPARP
jgi:hypothetical protein